MDDKRASQIVQRALSRGAVTPPAAHDALQRFRQGTAAGERPDVLSLLAEAAGVDREVLAALDETSMVGRTLGGFEVRSTIGEGGMGVVYRATQTSLGRTVALKVVDPLLALKPNVPERFRREATAVARLDHPNVVQPIDFGEDSGFLYFAMELMEGGSAGDRLKTGPLAEPELRAIALAIARALEYAELEGLVHRDIKPDNILFSKHGDIKLADLGIVLDRGDAGEALTNPDHMLGTPTYMAPEQAFAGRKIDVRTDIYGLGITLFELATGAPPFHDPDPMVVLTQHVTQPLPDLRERAPSVSAPFASLVERMTRKKPKNRFPSGAALREAVETLGAAAATGGGVGVEVEAEAPASVDGPDDDPVPPAPPAAAIGPSRARRAAVLSAAVLLAVTCWMLLVARRAEAPAPPGGEHAQGEASATDRALAGAKRSVAELRRALSDQLQLDRRRATHAEGVAAARTWLRAVLDAPNLRASETHRYREELRFLERTARDATEAYKRADTRLATDLSAARVATEAAVARAESLDPAATPVRDARIELLAALYCVAIRDEDRGEQERLARLLRDLDADRRHAPTLAGRGVLTLTGLSDGAQAYLFRMVRESDLPSPGRRRRRLERVARGRQVPAPVPLGSAEPAPGRLALVVLEDAGELRRHDLIAKIEGRRRLPPRGVDLTGQTAQLFREGSPLRRSLPAGLDVRATHTPLIATPRNHLPAQPPNHVLEAGSYLLLLRHPARRDVRYPFRLDVGSRCELRLGLPDVESAPPGFVHVAANRFFSGGDAEAPGSWKRAPREVEPFWMMEREVTAAEYAAFLNAPETRRRVESAGAPVLVPRRRDGSDKVRALWIREIDHRPPHPEAPIASISFGDARAYAEWRTRQEQARGGSYTYALPTEAEWELAARGIDERVYPWGAAYVDGWAEEAYWAEQVGSAPPLVRTRPMDESPFGVYDLAGSVAEWCLRADDPAAGDAAPALRGADPAVSSRNDSFRVASRRVADLDASQTTHPAIGFRLVARPRTPSKTERSARSR